MLLVPQPVVAVFQYLRCTNQRTLQFDLDYAQKKKARFKDGYESGPLWLRIALSLHNTPARKQVLAPLSTIHATPLKGLGATLSHPGEQKAKEGKQQTLANGFAQKITPSL